MADFDVDEVVKQKTSHLTSHKVVNDRPRDHIDDDQADRTSISAGFCSAAGAAHGVSPANAGENAARGRLSSATAGWFGCGLAV
jgi:hypothetical protein